MTQRWEDACAMADLHKLGDGLLVAELPAGLLTGIRALKRMGVPVKVRHAYDTLPCLALQDMSGFSAEDRRHMFFGETDGDLLRLVPEEMELVHILLSGPSCQPWSTKGSGGLAMRVVWCGPCSTSNVFY